MRIIGIDYGDSRIGIAVSDPLGITAQGVGTIKNKGEEKTLLELSKVLSEYHPEKIVIGLPKNMDGSLGFRAEATYAFAESLKTVYSGEIVFWDERLTTVGASRYLNETNTVKGARKAVIDTLSACLILEGYMQKNG
ncbi:MAG: Holliday junction resolvase RuvX [Clostridia bacterium]|nr:Holliday junction resolvase RuvX [Clostridia bacterium]